MNADDELLKNLDKLHTTELGVERIKRNLFLDTDDVVGWCKAKIDSVKAVITRSGKNWYVNIDNCIITDPASTAVAGSRTACARWTPATTRLANQALPTLASIMCLLSPSQQLQRPGDIRHRKKLQTNGSLQIFDLVSWHHALRKA